MRSLRWSTISVAFALLLVSLAYCVRFATKPKEVTGLACAIDEGTFLWHKLVFTNASGEELTNVRVLVSLTGISGESDRKDQFYGVWMVGTEKEVEINVSKRNRDAQKIEMKGTCDQGLINSIWMIQK